MVRGWTAQLETHLVTVSAWSRWSFRLVRQRCRRAEHEVSDMFNKGVGAIWECSGTFDNGIGVERSESRTRSVTGSAGFELVQ
jgi:hypothetical protein